MFNFKESIASPYSAEQIFDLIIDIEKYPEFLPWCKGARILSRGKDNLTAELLVKFKHITQSYISSVTYKKPNKIYVEQTSGPFKVLTNKWDLCQEEDNKLIIAFEINFEFESRLLNNLTNFISLNVGKKMVSSFIQRSKDIYSKEN